MKKILFPLFFILITSQFSHTQNNIFKMNNDADMMVLDGDYYAAIEKYKTILEINPSYINSIKGLAEAYFYLGEYDEAYNQIKTALTFDKNNIELMSLQAHILLALGNISEAEKIFRYINSKEPNNINAYFGFAEIALLTGKYSQSAGNYLNILSISPANRKALLSLILILDYQGKYHEAEKYLSEALRLYASDYFTLYVAARHYLESGDFAQSEKRVKESIKIKPDYLDSSLLYVKLLLLDRKYEQIRPLMEPFYKKKNNSIVSYCLGKACEKSGDYNNAIKYYAEAFKIEPDDEISRYSLEDVIRKHKDFTDTIRSKYAEYHFERGKGLDERNYTRKALESYRRGLLIDPYSVKGRLQYAGIYLKNGYRAKYLSELKTLPYKEQKKQSISDLIETYESMTENNIASRWKINQFLVDKNYYTFDIYHLESINMIHPAGEEVITGILSNIFTHSEIIKINKNLKISSYSEAFSSSRNSQEPSDYFIIVKFNEGQRICSVTASLYSTYTGTLIKEYRINTTGNNRIWETLNRLSEQIINDSGKEGKIIKINFDQGIINLGKLDGIKENDSFLIVKKDKIAPDRSRIGYTYSSSEIIGKFQVTKVDENISEGLIQSRDLFNLINHGDFVFPEKQNNTEKKEDTFISEYGLFNIILDIKQH